MISNYFLQRDPLAVGVDAIENVIATNGLKLARPYSVELNWVAYHSLDAILLLLSPFLLSFYLFVKYCLLKKDPIEKGKIE